MIGIEDLPDSHRRPRLDHLTPEAAARVLLTLSCTDTDGLAKVEGAGDVVERDGGRVQVMHNGVLIEEGCYYGPWMTEIIYGLRGHHEPQEEVVFAAVVDRLRVTAESGGEPGAAPLAMVELGSFWSYYGLWFASAIPGGQVVAMEPDPAYLEVGRRNFALNGLSERARFVHAAIGAAPGEPLAFTAESDGRIHTVVQHDLASLLRVAGLDRADLVLADTQGAETVLLERARDDLLAGRVRFLIVSTHHHVISGDPLTHQRALALLRECGAHVIAEHTPSESFSGDGLIAVSFDERDTDLAVEVSHARSGDSLFGGLEWDLEVARQRTAAAEAETARLSAELEALRKTKLFRWTRAPRDLYRRYLTQRVAGARRTGGKR